jgi:hypothetical protein
MQRNCEPIRKQVEAWQRSKLTDVTAKVVIYEGFIAGKLEAPKHAEAAHSANPIRNIAEGCISVSSESLTWQSADRGTGRLPIHSALISPTSGL